MQPQIREPQPASGPPLGRASSGVSRQQQQPSPTLIAETGRGGHRHLHIRFLFQFILDTEPELAQRTWFYATPEVGDAAAQALKGAARELFRSRLITALPSAGRRGLNQTLAVARSVKAGHILFLEVDQFIYALITRRLPLEVSGVWFRPSYHYSSAGLMHEGIGQKLTGYLKEAAARMLCGKRSIARLFVFDPWAAEYAARKFSSSKIQFVPDPLAFPTASDPCPPPKHQERSTFTIVGSISKRKGILSVLAALNHLCPEEQRKVEIRIVGRTIDCERRELAEAIQKARATTAATVVQVDAFVSDEEIDLEIIRAKVLLLTYQRFIGSSGLLIRAALYGRPVLATRYGLLGGLVKRHNLGLVVDPFSEKELAAAMALAANGAQFPYDTAGAQAFAASHSPEVYLRQLTSVIAGRRVETGHRGPDL